ncbi:hypothetical protein [Caldimonas brevitalea]|uniref:HMA domain-containing protein n=1 Tax=Caldimonas brevitalea TaxID=413882 RepID=A0A0G3BQL8_9BURK|nr:hypothetical protein [Caldimonas brevitalea]AKJ28805.1 hypothetical protein AAW51_2114 [Caldimonas brevitalea]
MDSKQVKAAFGAAGIKVRVADQGLKFRVCTQNSEPYADRAAAKRVAASLGLTDVFAAPGGQFSQSHELIAYKPGSIRLV